MKKTFKFGWLILAIGAVIAIVGAVFHGVKAVEFDGLKVQTVKKIEIFKRRMLKKNLIGSRSKMDRVILRRSTLISDKALIIAYLTVVVHALNQRSVIKMEH